jgi:signal transduction histidine kinase
MIISQVWKGNSRKLINNLYSQGEIMFISIRTKLLSGTLTLLLLFTGAWIVAIYGIRSLTKSIQTTQQLPMFISRASLEAEILIFKLKNQENEYLNTTDPVQQKRVAGEIDINEKKVVFLLDSIIKKTEPGQNKTFAIKTLKDFVKTEMIRKKILGLSEKEIRHAFMIRAMTDEAALNDQIEMQLDQIGKNANKKGALLLKEASEVSQHTQIIFISAFIFALLLGSLINILLSKSVSHRLNVISNATTRMAQGDLRQSIKIGENDELSQVARNFNRMAIELYDLYLSQERKVNERTNELNTANENLAKMKNELEIKVSERTTDLETKVHELNKSQTALLYMVEDLNRTSKKLKDAQEELVRKERLAILGEFSGNISHELRNPLGVIDSSIYFLKTRMKDKDDKTSQHLERISNSVKSSIAIIENLLNLTRMNKPVLTRYDCVKLISECLDSCTIPPGITVVRDFPNESIPILAENVQFQMVVNNLVKNAITAMNEEGKLTIKINRHEQEKVEVSFTDTGSGIDEANLEKVFQPLFSTRAKGIGLGLSITRMIVENHGGKIFVESTPGKGSRFFLRLQTLGDLKEKKNDIPITKT